MTNLLKMEPTSVTNSSNNRSHLEIGDRKPDNGARMPEMDAIRPVSGGRPPSIRRNVCHLAGYREGPLGPIY